MEIKLLRKNVTIGGHRTSLRLEREIWEALAEVCWRERLNMHQLCAMIDRERGPASRTSAVRAFAVGYYRTAATDAGHASAGHGGFTAFQAPAFPQPQKAPPPA